MTFYIFKDLQVEEKKSRSMYVFKEIKLQEISQIWQPQTQEAKEVSDRTSLKKVTLKQIIVKLLKTEDKSK